MKFSAQGRKIFKDAIQTDHGDGKSSLSLGFPVCEICEYVINADEIAKAIAEAMSKSGSFQ